MQIKAQNISKNFGSKSIIKDISLDIIPGQVLGLIGPNGAGKTTTIKIITGQIPPSSGQIIINNKSYKSVPSNIRSRFGIVPQEIIMWDSLNIKENLFLVLLCIICLKNLLKKELSF